MSFFGDHYRDKRVLVTGHTGFKGSWLVIWLERLGARVTGLALDPETSPSHWDLIAHTCDDFRIDIRDAEAVQDAVARARPEIVFHLAAQSLVRRSYGDPLESWGTNLMGTVNLLEACRRAGGSRAIVVVTSDKVYRNREWEWGYREKDPIGGADPYGASKAAAELSVASYRRSFFDTTDSPLLASARAGNVVGGGDWAEDRLLPDAARAAAAGRSLEVRSPNATRPWQHVLDCLSGYLLLGERLLQGDSDCADSWNFGPNPSDNLPVSAVLERLKRVWPELAWHVGATGSFHESRLLCLDSAKARSRLGWRPLWPLDTMLEYTAAWYRELARTGVATSHEQLEAYLAAAEQEGATWARR